MPVLAGIDWFAGRIQQRFDCGDHVAHLLAVLPDGRPTNAEADQLDASDAQDLDAGHDGLTAGRAPAARVPSPRA